MNRLIALTASLIVAQGCVYVEPKAKVAIDSECDTATPYYTVGIDDTPGEGLVIVNGRVGPNLPATVGSCGGDECIAVLLAMGRQFAMETVASLAYAVSHNLVAQVEKEALCRKKAEQALIEDPPEPEAVPLLVEDLGLHL